MLVGLEDEAGDVLGKAQKGLGLSTETLARMAGLGASKVRAARSGKASPEALAALARAMGLNAAALKSLSEGRWHPGEPLKVEGFRWFSTPFHDWQVNAFVVWDKGSRKAVAFDSGTSAKGMVDFLREEGLSLGAIMLTHSHPDHVQGIPDLLAAWPEAAVYLSGKESLPWGRSEPMAEGFELVLGDLLIGSMETTGHTAGGMTFKVQGLDHPVAIVGDALFAASMGGAQVSYQASLASVASILELPRGTLLGTGHGPLTTVGKEREMNCFAPTAS